MTGPRIGSLCTGYGGLDGGVRAVFGGETAWHADVDPGASAILAHHWPHVPNLGDISAVDWAAQEPVDILTAGFPCQDVSLAGLRTGLVEGTRSGLWREVARAIHELRPRLVVIENVRGLLSSKADGDLESCTWCVGDAGGEPALRALGAVLGDLAGLGFDAEWAGVRASEVGAAHQRERVFLLAWPAAEDADRAAGSERWLAASGQAEAGGARSDAGGRGGAPAADAGGPGLAVRGVEHHGSQLPAAERGRGESAADADGGGRRAGERDLLAGEPDTARCVAADAPGVGRDERRPKPARLEGRPGVAGGGAPDWGSYGAAIHRWERVTGRTAPRATDDRNRLSPVFVEWLMGLALGHVTAVPGLTRNQQLKALGNGVVPQQAEAAIRLLHTRAFPTPAVEAAAA